MKRSIVATLGIIGIVNLIAFGVEAAAAAPAEGMGGSALAQGLMLGAFALIFYFLILRPQNKRAKEHRNLVTSMQKGDEVITSGGLAGRITRVTDNFFMVTIAEGVEVPIQRQAVVASLPKGTLKSL